MLMKCYFLLFGWRKLQWFLVHDNGGVLWCLCCPSPVCIQSTFLLELPLVEPRSWSLVLHHFMLTLTVVSAVAGLADVFCTAREGHAYAIFLTQDLNCVACFLPHGNWGPFWLAILRRLVGLGLHVNTTLVSKSEAMDVMQWGALRMYGMHTNLYGVR